MIRNKDVINCLPLLASALGDRYGVQVRIGGGTAYTNGKVIHIPSLPLDCDKNTLALAKGYVDHESAHIRYTDFGQLKAAHLDHVTHCLFNALEDWRVEKKLCGIYPGCRSNLDWLIRTIFLKDVGAGAETPALAVLNYVLLTVRSWNVPELAALVLNMRKMSDEAFPGLAAEIDHVLQKVLPTCPDTAATIGYAKEIAGIIKNYQPPLKRLSDEDHKSTSGNNAENASESSNATTGKHIENPDIQQNGNRDGATDSKIGNDEIDASNPESRHSCDETDDHIKEEGASSENRSEENNANSAEMFSQLTDLFTKNSDDLPKNLGDIVAEKLASSKEGNPYKSLEIATDGFLKIGKLPADEKATAMRSSNALRQRLYGLLQTKTIKPNVSGRVGKLDAGNLYKLSVGNPRIFKRKSIRNGQNSAIHILLDVSGSMDGSPIRIARQACYSIAHSLENISGVNPAVTAFPAMGTKTSVCPIVKHGQKVTDQFCVDAFGGTPLGPALWWVLQNLYSQREERKIAIIITDGVPDRVASCIEAISRMNKLGIEVYGLGIKLPFIEELLPKSSRVIQTLSELVPAMFELLQKILLQGGANDGSF